MKDALLALPGEILRYELRLALRGGGTVSERPLVLELRPPSPGLADEEVEVPALSESGYALLTVSPTNGGTVRGFADVNGFGSEGGSPAVISLSSDATVLFDVDGLELTLTLTASSAGGRCRRRCGWCRRRVGLLGRACGGRFRRMWSWERKCLGRRRRD